MKRLTAVAESADLNRPVKYFVRGSMGVSYHQFSDLKRREGLRVNGQPVHANHLLHPGDLVEVFLEDRVSDKHAEPENAPVCMVYEDDDLYILDKPAPLACQCSPKQPQRTLENRLAWYFREDESFVFRPLNRLDKGTSGLMAATKNAHACQRLQKQLHTPAFLREYLAVVEGEMLGEGTIDLPIAKEEAATVRRRVDLENGRPAITHYAVQAHGNGRTLVRLRLETGRTHQIRVHLSHLGHPICGDFLYGTELEALPRRFALHAATIALHHPVTGERIERNSALPEALAQLLIKDCPS